MEITINAANIEDYRTFLAIKKLPSYRFAGATAYFDDKYADRLGIKVKEADVSEYLPSPFLFDYQKGIVELAIKSRKFCVFADCGLGKTLIFLEFARYVLDQLPPDKKLLIVSPLMVVDQTMGECSRFYGNRMELNRVKSSDVNEWLADEKGQRFGITNYEGMTDEVEPGMIGGLILDESSMLKSHYGKWGATCLRIGAGLDWKMCCTGTPAPNDRIEYANHAVLMDAFPNVNAFLAKYFVNRGQTNERWVLKPHASGPFYKALSHWSIFITNPATYGWKDNTEPLPPIITHQHHVDLTKSQTDAVFDQTGTLFALEAGGITSRSVLSQIAKGNHRGTPIETNKTQAIIDLLASWPGESTIVWCKYNKEQETMAKSLPGSASISGDTPIEKRTKIIDDFKAGRLKVLISKPKILGFGLNLQVATRQVFSGLEDSYEAFYQAVKRSNRYGSTKPLNVHIPYTDIERPMIQTVLDKAARVQEDTIQQERLFNVKAK